jgi:phosphoribosylformylglycinamidine synthase subunit PurS
MAKVNVYVTLKPSLLDSQGKVVQGALENLGYSSVESVRMGKYIQLEIADGNGKLEADVDDMCRKLLSNPVIEDYRYEIER